MTLNERWGQVVVLLASASLLLVPGTALATHNSHGVDGNIIQADEVVTGTGPDAGTIQPDVPSAASPNSDSDHPYVVDYHDNLEIPREHPPDQTGERYTGCDTFGDVGASNWDPANNENQCYIGFFDAQQEYIFWGNFFAVPVDPLYPYNPSEDDGYCTGEEAPEDHTGPAVPNDGDNVDQVIARAERTAPDMIANVDFINLFISGGECSGNAHKSYNMYNGDMGIDTDLLEAPLQSDQNGPGASGVGGTETGSGVMTLPQLTREYVFLFGEPHPDNPTPSGITAGEGIFGPNPAAGGSALTDLTNACGERTDACELLTKEDVIEYDRYTPEATEQQDARLCAYVPQLIAGINTAGPCGVFGTVVFEYVTDAAGGFGIDGAPNTYLSTLPGWFGFYFLANPSYMWPLDVSNEYADPPTEPFTCCWTDPADGETHPGLATYYAVNPDVPQAADPLWCVNPGFLAEGTGAGSISASEDPGVYGPYKADAIDSDIYTHVARGPAKATIQDTHPIVSPPAKQVIGLVEETQSTADDATSDTVDTIEQETGQDVPQAVEDALARIDDLLDRADYTESANQEADNQVNSTELDFQASVDAGLTCKPTGVVTFREGPGALYGGTQFTANLQRTTISIKDPTVLEDGLPAKESDTHEGAWQPDAYSFGGTIVGKFDSNRNGAFDGCADQDGQPHPDQDFCDWKALWDAYNPACVGEDEKKCNVIADALGYDVAGTDTDEASGVGLYFALKVTGPLVVTTDQTIPATSTAQDRTRVVGDNDPTAQNCVIGTSTGFLDHLPEHVGTHTGPSDSAFDDEDRGAICGDADGEIVLIEDAFDDQDGGNRGSYSAAVQWAKLAPTPEAVQQTTGGLGSGDSLCVNGVWSIQDSVTVTEDTTGNLDLDGSDALDPFTLSDCDSFETGTGPTEQG